MKSVSHEAQAQASGYANLQSVHGKIQRSLSESVIDPEPPVSDTRSAEEQAMDDEAACIKHVKDELRAYKAAGLFPETAPIDLLRFWQVS